MTWLTSNQTTRVSSYSLRNTLEIPSTLAQSLRGRTSTINPNFLLGRSFPRSRNVASSESTPSLDLSKRAGALPPRAGSEWTFAAFKVLPIDPARMRRASSGGDLLYAEAADELSGAASCREAVDMIVDCIRRACGDAGVDVDGGFVSDGNVVRCVFLFL